MTHSDRESGKIVLHTGVRALTRFARSERTLNSGVGASVTLSELRKDFPQAAGLLSLSSGAETLGVEHEMTIAGQK
jgi:hypothetical protein